MDKKMLSFIRGTSDLKIINLEIRSLWETLVTFGYTSK